MFPKATIWMEEAEYAYYTGPAWQQKGRTDGNNAEQIVTLVRLNTQGRVNFVTGDDREVLPGLRLYTGGRHTFASAYLRVGGATPFVIGCDDLPFYRYLEKRRATTTFEPTEGDLNLKAMDRMVELAGSADRVIPGHDLALSKRYPTAGRVTTIKWQSAAQPARGRPGRGVFARFSGCRIASARSWAITLQLPPSEGRPSQPDITVAERAS